MSVAVHFSDLSDSEIAASLIHSTRRSVKQPSSTVPPRPGVRRIRRFLNGRLIESVDGESDYDSYASASDWDDDELANQPIVDFEWEGRFVQVGPDFFHSNQAPPQLKKEHTDQAHRIFKHINKSESRRQERLERRSQRKKALVERGRLNDIVAARSSVSQASNEETISHSENQTDDQTTEMPSAEVPIPGQEFSADLWTLIDRPTRSLLRKMTDFRFLDDLEIVVGQFKLGEVTQTQSKYEGFRVVDREDDFVELVFEDHFVCSLAEGILPFHLLYHSKTRANSTLSKSSHLKAKSSELVLCVTKRRGFFMHHASLAKHIQEHYL